MNMKRKSNKSLPRYEQAYEEKGFVYKYLPHMK
jgi:hypothetical protein